MRSLVRFTTAALVVMSMLLTPAVHADSNTAKAKQLYDEGVTNYNLGHYEEALTAFEMSYRIRHDAAFLFNIAQCQRQLLRYQDAERSYRAYLRESTDIPASTRDEVQKLIADMDRAVAEEKEHAKQPPTGTQPPAEAPTSHAPVAATQPQQPETIQREPEYRRSWVKDPVVWTALTVGVAGLAVGGALLALAAHQGDLASAATTPDAFDSHHASDLNFQKGGWPVLAFGATAVVVGGIVIAVDHRRKGN